MNKDREKSFIKNTLIITIGKVCTQMLSFFLLPLYTNILTVDEYGIIDLFHTIVNLLLPIITLQIGMAIFRELLDLRKKKESFDTIITNGCLFTFFSCLIFVLISFLILPFVNNAYKYLLILNAVVAVVSSILLQIARGLGKNKEYAIGSFISAGATIILNVILLVIFRCGVLGMLLSTIIGLFISSIYLFCSLNIYKYIDFKLFSKNECKKMLKYSTPLIVNELSWWVFTASDRIVVSLILGMAFTGLLSFSTKFPSLITIIWGIFYLSFSENILLHSNDEYFSVYYSKMFNVVLKLFVSLSIGLIACMPFVFPIMIDSKFSEAFSLIPFLVIANIFNVIVSMIGVLYTANRNTKAIAKTSVISAIINLTVHLVLIKFIGLYAAVISTLVSYLIMAVYRYFTAKKSYFAIKIDMKMILLSIIILAIVLYTYYQQILIFNIVAFIIACIFALYLNKNSFVLVLKMLKEKINK